LNNLESTEADETGRPRLAHDSTSDSGKRDMVQLDLFGSGDWKLRERIGRLDINAMTPVEALMTLNELKDYVES